MEERRTTGTRNAESLSEDAQAARIKEHIRAVLTRLKSRALKSSRGVE